MADEIATLFKANDVDGNGTIDLAELTSVMTAIGFAEEECQTLFKKADLDKDGVISYQEFVTWIYSEDAMDGEVSELGEEAESAAPYLRSAFAVLAESTLDMQNAVLGEGTVDMEAVVTKQAESMAEFVSLLEQSFDHHNTEGTGVLSPEETRVFFSNLVKASGGFVEYLSTTCMRRTSEMMVKTVIDGMEAEASPDMPPEAKSALKLQVIAGVKEGMQAEMAKARQETARMIEDYLANKEERDAAAFKALDTNGDGTIEREEFKEAFTPGTVKNGQLMNILGLPQ